MDDEKAEKKFSIIGELDDEKEIKKLSRNNVMITIKDEKTKNKIEEEMSEKELNHNFFIPKIVSESIDKEKRSLLLRSYNLSDESLEKIEKGKDFSYIKKINLMEN